MNVQSTGIGLFGGTFDPIHIGHVRLARALRDELNLSRVCLIPVGQPVHRHTPLLSNAERLHFVRLAIANEPGLEVDDREIRRNRPSYTVETLRDIRDEVGTQCPLYWLIGLDAFVNLHTWHQWQHIFELCHLVVAQRPNIDMQNLPSQLQHEWTQRYTSNLAKPSPAGTIRALSLMPLDISATAIRNQLLAGQDPSEALPEALRRPLQQRFKIPS